MYRKFRFLKCLDSTFFQCEWVIPSSFSLIAHFLATYTDFNVNNNHYHVYALNPNIMSSNQEHVDYFFKYIIVSFTYISQKFYNLCCHTNMALPRHRVFSTTTRMPAFWGYPPPPPPPPPPHTHFMITHTIESTWIPSQKTKSITLMS